MHNTKAQKPKQQRMGNHKTVDDAEQEFSIPEPSQHRIRIVTTINERETIKQKHNGRRQTIVPLYHQRHTQETASNNGNKEINEHLPHPLIENKAEVMSFGLGYGHRKNSE